MHSPCCITAPCVYVSVEATGGAVLDHVRDIYLCRFWESVQCTGRFCELLHLHVKPVVKTLKWGDNFPVRVVLAQPANLVVVIVCYSFLFKTFGSSVIYGALKLHQALHTFSFSWKLHHKICRDQNLLYEVRCVVKLHQS